MTGVQSHGVSSLVIITVSVDIITDMLIIITLVDLLDVFIVIIIFYWPDINSPLSYLKLDTVPHNRKNPK